jgi:N-acetylmuramoyl-L-alanine amidase
VLRINLKFLPEVFISEKLNLSQLKNCFPKNATRMKKYLTISGILLSFSLFSSFYNPDNGSKSKKKVVHHSIFGKKYAAVTIESSNLKGHVYYIVSGHGGPDPGAVTSVDGHRISEDEYAYDISLRLARNLISHGAKVYMIVRDENDGIRDDRYLKMDKDEVVHGGERIPLNHAERLRQRTRIINNLHEENRKKGFKVQRVIETHVDSRQTDKNIDIFFYYHKDKAESKNLAHEMRDTIMEKYNSKQKGRGYSGSVSSRGLWMINQSTPPTVYIELGNITNEQDRKRLLIANNRQAIANWLSHGILKYK